MKQYRAHLFVAFVLVVALITGVHHALHRTLTDLRFGWLQRPATGQIALVAIDSPSIESLGVWPWPRDRHAALIERLQAAGATDIVFDVDFSSPSGEASDRRFAAALARAGGSVVLPSFQQVVRDREGHQTIHVNRPLPLFAKQAWPATVNVQPDSDGLMRRYAHGEVLDGQFLPSVGALLAGRYDPRAGPFGIDFGIRPDTVPRLSYADVLRGGPDVAAALKDRKVIIGSTAIELGDRFNVPNGHVLSGPMLQILAAESLLQGRALQHVSDWVTLAGLGLIVLLMMLLWRRTPGRARTALLMGLAILIELGALATQALAPVVVDTAFWQIAILAYLTAIALDEIDFRSLLAGIAERRFHRIAMALGDGLICSDDRGRVTVCNPAAAAIFGYDPADLIGRDLDGLGLLGTDAAGAPFMLAALAPERWQQPGGCLIELEGRRRTGETFALEACISGWAVTDGVNHGLVLRDISVRKREEARLRWLAEYDTLTGIANRNTLHQHLAERLAAAAAVRREVGLLLLDLDNFKDVNDTLGHAAGDDVLRAVAAELKTLSDGHGLVARLSGDEFAVVLSADDDVAAAAAALARRATQALTAIPMCVGERRFPVKASFGIAVYPAHGQTVQDLLANADIALYEAKGAGRGRHVVYRSEFRETLERRQVLEAELRRAVEADEFELFYQPQVDLADHRLVGAEALIRWRHPERGVVSPAEFMPVINATSLSEGVSAWVMATACRQAAAWQRQGHAVRVGVNLSPSQLGGDLPGQVSALLAETGLPPALLELEVTEDILIKDDAAALAVFRRLREIGVGLAFDDFGTGYASLTYLKTFPLDRLKIDRDFVRELRVGSDDAAIVCATISLARMLNLATIAEGIEDDATAALLASFGCGEGQGYHFGKPMPVAEFEQRFLGVAARDGVAA